MHVLLFGTSILFIFTSLGFPKIVVCQKNGILLLVLQLRNTYGGKCALYILKRVVSQTKRKSSSNQMQYPQYLKPSYPMTQNVQSMLIFPKFRHAAPKLSLSQPLQGHLMLTNGRPTHNRHLLMRMRPAQITPLLIIKCGAQNAWRKTN